MQLDLQRQALINIPGNKKSTLIFFCAFVSGDGSNASRGSIDVSVGWVSSLQQSRYRQHSNFTIDVKSECFVSVAVGICLGFVFFFN